MKRLKYLGLVVAAILAIAAGAITSHSAKAAQKGLVEGCARATTCVDAYTGGKNYQNHTQWVDSVEVFSTGRTSFVETWGDGFYYKASGADRIFRIGRWVRSGTNICGASTDPNGFRLIACISIRA